MRHGLRVSAVCLLYACGGPVDVVGVVGGSDPTQPATPVVSDVTSDAAVGTGDGGAQSEPFASAADAASGGLGLEHDSPAAGSRAGSGLRDGAPPVDAAGCAIIDQSACSRARMDAFSRVLCACGDVAGPSTLQVSSESDSQCAPVGVDGNFAVAGGLRTNVSASQNSSSEPGRDPQRGVNPSTTPMGSPQVAPGSAGPSAPVRDISIGGDLEVGGTLAVTGDMHVMGDVWSQSAPIGPGLLQIDGDLVTTESFDVRASNVRLSGTPRFDPHTQVEPCACDANSRLDIAALIRGAAQRNDDADLSIAQDALAAATSSTSLEIACGRVYLSGITVLGDLTLRISGPVQLYVAGDFAVLGRTQVELGDSGELDLFVAGNLMLGGSAHFAAREHSADARVYVAGQMMLGLALSDVPWAGRLNAMLAGAQLPAASVPSMISVVGNVYAPSAVLQVAVPTEVVGSLFVGGVVLLQELSLRCALPPTGAGCGL